MNVTQHWHTYKTRAIIKRGGPGSGNWGHDGYSRDGSDTHTDTRNVPAWQKTDETKRNPLDMFLGDKTSEFSGLARIHKKKGLASDAGYVKAAQEFSAKHGIKTADILKRIRPSYSTIGSKSWNERCSIITVSENSTWKGNHYVPTQYGQFDDGIK